MDNKTLVFLHGYLENSSIWSRLLKQLTYEFNAITIDLPGFGKNENHYEKAKSIKEMADFVFHEIKKEENIYIIGHSLGGYVSLELAKMYPKNIKGLFLINSNALSDSNERKNKRDQIIQFINKHGIDLFAKSFVPPMFASKEKYKKEIDEVLMIASQTQPIAACNAALAMKLRNDNIEYIKNTKIPVKMIFGDLDPFITKDEIKLHTNLSESSESHILENIGHMAMYEDINTTSQLITEFVCRY